MKVYRQRKILELISEKPVGTQEQLARELQSAGYDVTQATVSRDIRELGLVKAIGENGTAFYTSSERSVSVQNEERLKRLLRGSVVSTDFSENLIIIKTYPGEAQGVASALDLSDWKEIIGTVAGDDTVLVIVKPKKAAPEVITRLTVLSAR